MTVVLAKLFVFLVLLRGLVLGEGLEGLEVLDALVALEAVGLAQLAVDLRDVEACGVSERTFKRVSTRKHPRRLVQLSDASLGVELGAQMQLVLGHREELDPA